MKVFAQNIQLSAVHAEAWARYFAQVAEGPDEKSYGICYNVSQLADHYGGFGCNDGYTMTEELFACVIGFESIFPLHSRPNHMGGWAIREKWCAAFAESFTTGEIVVDDEMEESLSQPIDRSLIIRHDAYID